MMKNEKKKILPLHRRPGGAVFLAKLFRGKYLEVTFWI